MKLIKEVVKVDDKRYTNYILVITINGQSKRVAIQPKTFGKAWNDPQVRATYTVLDLVSELVIKDD